MALKDADRENRWYSDYLEFQASEGIFARFLTPARDGGGDPERRWDTQRICQLSEVSAFYGLAYWYTWQVTILGLGPIFQSENEAARAKAARLLEEGSIFAFGLSERAHGADIYSTDMVLTPDGGDGFTASGGKYYIGNGNEAGMVSVFGRVDGIEGPDGYAFFAADSQHPNYELIRNVVNSQNYVSQFELHDYPVAAADVLHRGPGAFDAALNTVNIGKFNLGFASIGICEHALHESITHADWRVLYGIKVTDFPHVRQAFTDSYARLIAMKLFANRAIDYMRSANPDDRRYLLFNPLTKMKVTTEGERVIDALWDVMAAKGFERDMFFEMAARDIRGLPKLEGTVHVNMALVLKFMAGYLFNPDPELAPPGADPRSRRRRFPVPAGTGPRALEDPLQPLAGRVRAVRRRRQRRPLRRAGRVVQDAADRRGPGRGPAARPRLPAHPRRAVHADPLRPADLRAGGLRRAARRHARSDLRRADPGLLRLRRGAARQDVVDRGSAGVGAERDRQAGRGRRPLRLGLRQGPGTGGPVRDARVASQTPAEILRFASQRSAGSRQAT